MNTMSSPLEADADLPICTLCGTQYDSNHDRKHCPICEDERQWVAETGQKWTSLRQLRDEGHRWELLPDRDDRRISLIKTTPSVGIGQCPALIETSHGSYVWDCAAWIDQSLVDHLKSLRSPLKAICISHPHFYTTSLTWSRALGVPLVLAVADKEWFFRETHVTDEIRWLEDCKEIGPDVKMIRCGGHFPGSSVLIWDRSNEPSVDGVELPQTGIAFVADTLMVQPTQAGFAYVYSVPNLIPLGPPAIVKILNMIWVYTRRSEADRRAPFEQATSSWPGRWIRKDAWSRANDSAVAQLHRMGWSEDGPLARPANIEPASIRMQADDFEREYQYYEEQFTRQGKIKRAS